MAFSPVATETSDKTSVQSILESEAGILSGMAEFFCSTNGVVDKIQNTPDVKDKLIILDSILPAYTNKENSVAEVLHAAAKKLTADNNVLPRPRHICN